MREPYTDYIPTDARRAGWDEFEAARRDHADLPQVYARALHAAAPLILAAELDRLAAEYRRQSARQREHTARLDHGGAAQWQIEGSVSSQQELGGFVRTLEGRSAELRATPAAVTPEPAGPRLREWTDPENGPVYEVQPGWAVWAVSREEAEAQHAHFNSDGLSYGTKVEDLAYHGATEVPAVPPAEPGAGA